MLWTWYQNRPHCFSHYLRTHHGNNIRWRHQQQWCCQHRGGVGGGGGGGWGGGWGGRRWWRWWQDVCCSGLHWSSTQHPKQIQQASGDTVEKQRFKEFFGTSLEVVEILWEKLYEGDFLPDKSQPKHLLWTCYFLKVYPKQETGCSAMGGISGAISPKTMKHWVWGKNRRAGRRRGEYFILYCYLLSLYHSHSYHHVSNIKDNLQKQTESEGYSQRLHDEYWRHGLQDPTTG